jgi:PAS domain-containing protein
MSVSSAGVDPQHRNDIARQIGLLKQGEHLCSVYAEREEMLAQVVPYVRTGLLNGERCIYVADENGQESIITALTEGGVDAELEMERNRLVFWSRDEYRQSGEFDLNKMLDFVNRNLDRALAEGHEGLRLAVEMTWTINNGVNDDELVAWEDLINKISFSGSKVSFLCQYNSRLLSPDLVKKAVYVHPMVVLGQVVCPNLYYRPAAAALIAQDHGDLAWLLAKLGSQSVGPDRASVEVPTLKQVYDVITTALTQLPVGLYMCESPTGLIQYYNPRAAEIWGRTPNCGDSNERCCTALTLITPDGTELSHDQCPMAQAIRHGVIVSDRELIIERSSTPIRNSNGRVVGALALMQDITERKHAETAMAGLIKNLEQSRTELQDKIEDLEKFEEVVVGRELKMIEQEKEIEQLKKELAAYQNKRV